MYRRVYAKINLDAIENNFMHARSKINPGTKIMAVIKADAYGHGAVPIANLLSGKADYFGVAIVEEAVELRKNGINLPILILGYSSVEQYKTILEYGIEQTIFTYEAAKTLSDVAINSNKVAKIHIAVDTGMSRIGFKDDYINAMEIKKISLLPNIEIIGLFSHFACADSQDKSSANKQITRYNDFVEMLKALGVVIPIKHLANSAAIIDMDANYDMVRLGISLYGLYPSCEVKKENMSIVPAMELKTHIINLKTLEAGTGISYGHIYVTDRVAKIATIPVGYADGYPRALSSKGRVIINGEFAPIVGRICMDQFMVDVTHIDNLTNENEVILIGSENSIEITAEEIGSLSERFNYEVVCNVSKRVPRVFFLKGKEVLSQSFF